MDTKQAIQTRVARRPQFSVVPDRAIRLIEDVIEREDHEARRRHPDDFWARVEYWKGEILQQVIPALRGQLAVYFHEYIAATLRGDSVEAVAEDDDPWGFSSRPYNPAAEAIAQRDAYLACTASL